MESKPSSFKCKTCSSDTILYEYYDAYVCIVYNSWNEKQCGDDKCYYCVNRPEKPLKESQYNSIKEALNEDENKLPFESILQVVWEVLNEYNYK